MTFSKGFRNKLEKAHDKKEAGKEPIPLIPSKYHDCYSTSQSNNTSDDIFRTQDALQLKRVGVVNDWMYSRRLCTHRFTVEKSDEILNDRVPKVKGEDLYGPQIFTNLFFWFDQPINETEQAQNRR
jgi:hypothetical protein